jgi:hypothetical protein
MREARRAGRRQEGRGGMRPFGDKGPHGTPRASVSALPVGPAGGAVGSPESLHGTELKQGLVSLATVSASVLSKDRWAVASGTGRGAVFRGPQQHEAPAHRLPHLQ